METRRGLHSNRLGDAKLAHFHAKMQSDTYRLEETRKKKLNERQLKPVGAIKIKLFPFSLSLFIHACVCMCMCVFIFTYKSHLVGFCLNSESAIKLKKKTE